MNFKKLAETHVEKAFKFARELVKNIEYHELVSTRLENYQTIPEYSSMPLRGIVSDFTRYEIDSAAGAIALDDKKILIPAKDLYSPIRIQSKLFIDGQEYQVIHVESDPTDTLCTVQCRRAI